MTTDKVEQTLKEEEEAIEVPEGGGSNGQEATEPDEETGRPKTTVPAIGQGKSTGGGEKPEKKPNGSLGAFREYVMSDHPLRKTVEIGFLFYQVDQGAYRGKRPDQVSKRRNEISSDSVEYVHWFIRTNYPIDIQLLALDYLDQGPLPDELNLEHTSYTPAVCELMLDAKARQAMELLIALNWDGFAIAKSINDLERGFDLDAGDVDNFKYLLWNIADLEEYALAGYIGELAEEIKRSRVVQSPVEGPIPWARFSLGLGTQPLETYESFVRYMSGYSEISSELVNLGLRKLDKGTLTRQMRAMIFSGFNSIDFCLRRGKREAAHKLLKPLKDMTDLALKLEIDIMDRNLRF